MENTNTKITCEVDFNNQTLLFKQGEKTRLIEAEKLEAEIQIHGKLHGIKQKIVDATAISRDEMTGKSASPETKWQALLDMAARLEGGVWNVGREGGSNISLLLVKALFEFYGGEKTMEYIRNQLAAKTPQERKALSLNPKISKIIDKLEKEQLKTLSIDSDDLLNRF